MRVVNAVCLFLCALLYAAAAQAQWVGGYYGRPYPYGGWVVPAPVPPPVAVYPYQPYPPPVVVVPAPPVATYTQPPVQFSYWCDSPRGYYPAVVTCNGPWRETIPPPPPR